MVPSLVQIIRGHTVDSLSYLKGLLMAGEVASAARQAPDRQLTRIVTDALQRRVDAAAGDTALPVRTALQLVANVAALIHALGPMEEFALAHARGDTPETQAAAAEAAAVAASSRSPSPGRRSRSQSPGKAGAREPRGRAPAEGGGTAAAEPGDGQSSPLASRASSHASAPSPPRSPSPTAGAAPAPSSQQTAQPQASDSHQSGGHTVLSLSASGSFSVGRAAGGQAAAASAAAGGSATAFQALLESAEALVVQAMAAKAAGWLAEGEGLDWAPSEQARSTAYTPHIDQLVLYLKVRVGGALCCLLRAVRKAWVARCRTGPACACAGLARRPTPLAQECASLLRRSAPEPSVERVLRGVLRYLADAFMLQLMSGGWWLGWWRG